MYTAALAVYITLGISMKRYILIALGCLVLVGWTGEDPIDGVIKSLDTHDIWKNGIFPTLSLPGSASSEEVIEKCLKKIGFDKGHIQKYKIIKTKKVTIAPDAVSYNAALINSDLGRKVILFRYEGVQTGWWTRVYDAK